MFSITGNKKRILYLLLGFALICAAFVGGVSAEDGSVSTDGYLSIGLDVVLFVAAVLMFVISAIVLNRGVVLALIPMVASPIICIILTAVSGLGKVADVTYQSGVVNNALVTGSTVTLISPVVVIIFGLVTAIIVILTIYIVAQVVVNLSKPNYTENESEKEWY